jgi:PAS domain S-box-containing protein
MSIKEHHKILVVEDEGLIAHDIASRLESMGHTVVAMCGTAEEAIEKASEAEIVLMDIRLDGPTDGIAAANQIREKYHLPVVFLTGQSDPATLERAKTAEPFGYIVKPLAQATLQTSIEVGLYKHRMERDLREREAWLRTLFTSVTDAVIVSDPQGRAVMLNRAAEILTGWTQAEAAGKQLERVVRLLGKDGDTLEPVALAILRDEAAPFSARLISRTGRESMVEGAAAPVKSAGQTLGVGLTLRDVSARRWEERQIQQAQKLEAVARLAAGVSNEYTALLATIRNHARQLLHQFGEYSPARKAAEQIEQAAIAAEEVNRRLAALGARQASQPEMVSLNALIRKTTKLIESVLGAQVELSVRLDASVGKIKADPGQMEQVLMGLALHASATMPDGGRLLIETGTVDIPPAPGAIPYTMLAMTYTGHENDPEKLFEPASMEEQGVALSMIHAIVTEHAGYISAQPTESGGGRFEALFPALRSLALQAPVTRPSMAGAPAILYVDPRDHVRIQLHNFFETHGYNLLEAADREEALAIAQIHDGRLDLLIADERDLDAIAPAFQNVEALRIVSGPERAPNEMQRPFTQQALIDRVDAILRSAMVAAKQD